MASSNLQEKISIGQPGNARARESTGVRRPAIVCFSEEASDIMNAGQKSSTCVPPESHLRKNNRGLRQCVARAFLIAAGVALQTRTARRRRSMRRERILSI